MMGVVFTRGTQCKDALKCYIDALRTDGIAIGFEDADDDCVEFEFEDAGGSVLVTLADGQFSHDGAAEQTEDPWDRDDFSETTKAADERPAQPPEFVLQRIWKTIELLASEPSAAAEYLAQNGSTVSRRARRGRKHAAPD